MKPYYQDEAVTIYHGDNRNILQILPEIDLTVTSPPYDNMREYGGYVFDFNDTADGLIKCTKEGGVIVWTVADATVDGSETGTSFRQALSFMDKGLKLHDTMIYQKDNPPPVGGTNRYYQHF